MAALTRPTLATHCINERVTIDTTDNEDHSFSGILFPIQSKDILPVNHIVINTIYVRGGLGPITVWVSNESFDRNAALAAAAAAAARQPQQQPPVCENNSRPRFFGHYSSNNNGNDDNNNGGNNTTTNNTIIQGRLLMSRSHWTKIYEKEHRASFREYEPLDLSDNPIILKPGQVRGVYIHSSIDDDTGIIYDNQQKLKTYDDKFITVLPGRSHVSTKPFGTRPIWGMGNAWRDCREFVGRLSYGVVYDLWNPSEHSRFGNGFRYLALILFAMQRRIESPFCRLPDECIYYILNMCRWDWAEDTFDQVREYKKKLRRRLQEANVAAATAAAALASEVRNDKEVRATATTDGGQATVAEAASSSAENVMTDSINILETNNDADMQDGEEEDDQGEDFLDYNEDDEEFDEDFSEEDDSDDDDDIEYDSEPEPEPAHHLNFARRHEMPSSFVYNVYDDCASSGEDERRESRRLTREREERRRWMSRLHILQHWVGVEEVQFSVGNDENLS